MDWRFDFEKSGGLGRISATLGVPDSACSLAQAMMGTAILDIVIGAFLLILSAVDDDSCWLCPPYCHIDS